MSGIQFSSVVIAILAFLHYFKFTIGGYYFLCGTHIFQKTNVQCRWRISELIIIWVQSNLQNVYMIEVLTKRLWDLLCVVGVAEASRGCLEEPCTKFGYWTSSCRPSSTLAPMCCSSFLQLLSDNRAFRVCKKTHWFFTASKKSLFSLGAGPTLIWVFAVPSHCQLWVGVVGWFPSACLKVSDVVRPSVLETVAMPQENALSHL